MAIPRSAAGEVVSNLRNAAIVLMSLPQDEAAQLLGRLQPRQVEAVSLEIAKLGRFTGYEQEQALRSFAESNPNALGGSTGGLDAVRTLLERALGSNAASTMENLHQTVEGRPFDFLKAVDPQDLLPFLIDEHPQTIALVLSHLSASYGAQIIAGLPSDRRLQVIRRIAHMGPTSPDVVRQVEQGLEDRMSAVVNQRYKRAGGVPAAAEILNVCQRATGRAMLESLAEEDPDLAGKIRRLKSAFEDISRPGDKDIQ